MAIKINKYRIKIFDGKKTTLIFSCFFVTNRQIKINIVWCAKQLRRS